MLDDPFATFDAARQERFLDWLKIRSRKQQVLIFTCRPDYARYADQIINLEKFRELKKAGAANPQ